MKADATASTVDADADTFEEKAADAEDFEGGVRDSLKR